MHDCTREKGVRLHVSGSWDWTPLELPGHVSRLAKNMRKMPKTSSDTASFVQFCVTFAHFKRRLMVAYGAS